MLPIHAHNRVLRPISSAVFFSHPESVSTSCLLLRPASESGFENASPICAHTPLFAGGWRWGRERQQAATGCRSPLQRLHCPGRQPAVAFFVVISTSCHNKTTSSRPLSSLFPHPHL